MITAFEIRPFQLSETTKICGRQSIVTMRWSSRTTTFVKDIFTLHYYLNILKTFISQVTVRVYNFDYIGEHLLVIWLMFSESCGNRLGCSYILLADNLKFQRTTWKSDQIVRWTTSFLTLISNAGSCVLLWLRDHWEAFTPLTRCRCRRRRDVPISYTVYGLIISRFY